MWKGHKSKKTPQVDRSLSAWTRVVNSEDSEGISIEI